MFPLQKKSILGALLCAWLMMPASAAQYWEARVRYIVDGDTLWVTRAESGKRVKLRLRGMDAPEICQPDGDAARRALQQLARGQRVQVRVHARDRYGRSVADVWRAGDGLNLAARMVEDGWAWSDGHRRSPYAMQQAAAQVARRGVFARDGAQRPSEFRRQHGACHVDKR